MEKAQELIQDAEYRMSQSVEALSRELMHLRAGRANAGLVDHIRVEAYGEQMPLNQIATVSAPDATMIMISPFDKSLVSAVEKAINTSDLGLMPQSDGSLIRINIPPLTDDRRKELVKAVHKHGEESRVALRNIRRDANDHLKKLEKAKEMSEDQFHDFLANVDKLLETKLEELEQLISSKEKDITDF
jgi:ribosome recycling factor